MHDLDRVVVQAAALVGAVWPALFTPFLGPWILLLSPLTAVLAVLGARALLDRQ